jgi:hypothetical protein
MLAVFVALRMAAAEGTNHWSIARIWNERALAAIRADTPHPPAQARNYFSFSVCMYDAWAAYDTNGSAGFVYHQKHTAADVAAARREAISYAVFRMMKERHAFSRTAGPSLAADDTLMTSLGYDINNNTRDTSTPAGVGNAIYDAVTQWFSNDGARGTNGTPYNPATPSVIPVAYPDYPAGDPRRYVFTNPALATDRPGIDDGSGGLDAGLTVSNINRWQRLNVVNAVDQNGFPTSPMQPYLGAQWLGVRPYQMARLDPTLPWIDPGAPPFYGGATHAQFVDEIVAVIRASSELTADDGVMMDISPAVYGNNSLDFRGVYGGTNGLDRIYDGRGYTNNPVTGQPYAPNVVKRGDYVRALSEYWADGPNSETPPGHWNVVANGISDSPLVVKRIGGTGPVVDDLEWDVKLYFALNAATHEAACAAWGVKRYYDAYRPLSCVRFLGMLGQSTSPALPSYNANGLPLVTNLIELVTSASVSSGRHAGLLPGRIALRAWPGETAQRTTPNGVHWVHAEAWTTYQRSNFVTPAFPGYISGHSTFSRSAAELLTGFTGSKYYPGGLGTYTITNLLNEKGPSAPVTLTYATYYDAADDAGLSRIYGGIHPPIDNFGGRRVGAMAGTGVWETARKYFDGSITNNPVNLTLAKLNTTDGAIRFNTIRAMYYKLQVTTNLSQPFTDLPGGTMQAFDASITVTNGLDTANKFYRAVQSVRP